MYHNQKHSGFQLACSAYFVCDEGLDIGNSASSPFLAKGFWFSHQCPNSVQISQKHYFWFFKIFCKKYMDNMENSDFLSGEIRVQIEKAFRIQLWKSSNCCVENSKFSLEIAGGAKRKDFCWVLWNHNTYMLFSMWMVIFFIKAQHSYISSKTSLKYSWYILSRNFHFPE